MSSLANTTARNGTAEQGGEIVSFSPGPAASCIAGANVGVGGSLTAAWRF